MGGVEDHLPQKLCTRRRENAGAKTSQLEVSEVEREKQINGAPEQLSKKAQVSSQSTKSTRVDHFACS